MANQIVGRFKSLVFSRLSGSRRRRRSRREQSNTIEILELRQMLTASFSLLKDINAGPGGSGITTGSGDVDYVRFGEFVYFRADDGVSGTELWRTDGSEAGTQQVADLLSGPQSSVPGSFVVGGNILYFSAVTEAHTTNFDRLGSVVAHNGTLGEFTVLHTSEVEGTGLAPRAYHDGTLFLFGLDTQGGTNLNEFWLSDGTAAGTQFVTDDIANFVSFVYNDRIFFNVELKSAPGDRVLWSSDGTVAGTGPYNPAPGELILSPVGAFEGVSYFIGSDDGGFNPNDATHLWKQAVGDAVPQRLVSSNPNTNGPTNPGGLAHVGRRVYFRADSAGGTRNELWRTDGTPDGTVKITFTPSSQLNPEQIVSAAGAAFFVGRHPDLGVLLWRSDGNRQTTFPIETDTDDLINIGELTSFREYLVFTAGVEGEPIDSSQLWFSNGYMPGNIQIRTVADTLGTANHRGLTEINDRLLMVAENDAAGEELFVLTLSGDPLDTPMVVSPPSTTVDARPTLSWTDVEGTNQYEVWLKNQSSGVDRFFVDGVVGNSHTPTNDLPLGTYSLWVRALGVDGAPSSPWSMQYNFRVETTVTLVEPKLNQSTSRPTISWQELPGAVHYDVWIDRLDTTPVTREFLRDPIVHDNSFTPDTDMPIGRYRIWVRGVDGIGRFGRWSEQATFHVVTPPSATGGINSTFGTTPTIEWESVAGATAYEVYLSNASGGRLIAYEQNITDTSFTPANLPAGEYKYWLLAVGETGQRGLWSDPIEFSTRGKTTLLAPTGTLPRNPYPVFEWRAVDGAASYEIFGNEVNEREGTHQIDGITGTTYTMPPPASHPLGTYRVWVRAISSTGERSPWSESIVFTVVHG